MNADSTVKRLEWIQRRIKQLRFYQSLEENRSEQTKHQLTINKLEQEFEAKRQLRLF